MVYIVRTVLLLMVVMRRGFTWSGGVSDKATFDVRWVASVGKLVIGSFREQDAQVELKLLEYRYDYVTAVRAVRSSSSLVNVILTVVSL